MLSCGVCIEAISTVAGGSGCFRDSIVLAPSFSSNSSTEAFKRTLGTTQWAKFAKFSLDTKILSHETFGEKKNPLISLHKLRTST